MIFVKIALFLRFILRKVELNLMLIFVIESGQIRDKVDLIVNREES